MKNLIQKIKCRIPKNRWVRVLLIIAFVYITSSPFVSLSFPAPQVTQSCGSIVFDKWAMNSVDRIEIVSRKNTTVITDKRMIKKFVKEAMTADSADLAVRYPYTVNLYNDDRIVRRMKLGYGLYYAEVYEPGLLHFNFCGSEKAAGMTELSNELRNLLKEFVESDGHFIDE